MATTTTETLKYTKTTQENGYWFTQYHNTNNKLHRTGGPALENSYGFKGYYANGQRHRIEGPAFIWPDGPAQWYLYDEKLTEAEHTERVAAMNKVEEPEYREVID